MQFLFAVLEDLAVPTISVSTRRTTGRTPSTRFVVAASGHICGDEAYARTLSHRSF